MTKDYFVLSNFDTHYFLTAFTSVDNIPDTVGADEELNGILSADIGKFNKENTKYRTLNGNGWESIATLGNTNQDGSFSMIREGSGDAYTGAAGTSTYTKLKDWFMKATASGGVASPRIIVEILPRGGATYEGTVYFVVPNEWGPGTRDTETGQEYTFSVSVFGPSVPVGVTYNSESGKWTLAKG